MSDGAIDAPLLEVEGLTTIFDTEDGPLAAVRDVSITLRRGEILGLVGESGSGKSVTGFSLLRLVDPPGRIAAGRILFGGQDLVTTPEREMRRLRGARIAMIFQDPMMTLNPVLSIGTQMAEVLTTHRRTSRRAAWERAEAALAQVGVPSPGARLKSYPHELSGGMRQRVAIATALLCDPEVIIADEPTTALDVTIQGQILHEVQALVERTGAALIWISHDLSVVASLADTIAVMYAGRILERGPTAEVIAAPAHPYTAGLLRSAPAAARPGEALRPIPGAATAPAQAPVGRRRRRRGR
ncbi:MAG: ABC transporter ATP-binding protein, partial [Pseudomonadota bacterium]